MQERKVFKFATANAHFGELIRADDGLVPFSDRDSIGLQEVRQKRDGLRSKLDDAEFEVVEHETDLAIAVRKGTKVGETRVFPIESGRLFGDNHVVIAVEIFAPGEKRCVVATAHPDVPIRPYARWVQGRKMARVFKDSFFEGDVIFGMDANHYPRPWFIDRRLNEQAGFTSLQTEPTYPLAESKHAWLGKLGFPDGTMDVILHKGNGIQEVDKRVVKIRSDHRAVFGDFEIINKN